MRLMTIDTAPAISKITLIGSSKFSIINSPIVLICGGAKKLTPYIFFLSSDYAAVSLSPAIISVYKLSAMLLDPLNYSTIIAELKILSGNSVYFSSL